MSLAIAGLALGAAGTAGARTTSRCGNLRLTAAGGGRLDTAHRRATHRTYVERGGFDIYLRHPATLGFSVDGDAVGEHLRWDGWGQPRSIAHGIIDERDYPSNRRVRVRGTIVVSRLQSCRGARYYTREAVHATGHLPFRIRSSSLHTPCNGR